MEAAVDMLGGPGRFNTVCLHSTPVDSTNAPAHKLCCRYCGLRKNAPHESGMVYG
jgi:hypothetical protein